MNNIKILIIIATNNKNNTINNYNTDDDKNTIIYLNSILGKFGGLISFILRLMNVVLEMPWPCYTLDGSDR